MSLLHPIQIEIDATSVLSYAAAYNKIAIVSQIRVRNPGTAVQGAVVAVEVRDEEGVLSAPCELLVDLAAESEAVLSEVGLRVDPASMLQIEEQHQGYITVRISVEDEIVAEHDAMIQLLAARQWLRAYPVGLSMELLAAFVMPNDPAVTALVSDAADLLGRRTGSPSVEGYQSGEDRVDQIARAVFDAMQAKQVRYSEPPASWADNGQKVRTPTEVLDGRMGTCLDTVVVLAAALEQAGIRPLLWLVEGHAFLGYWRTEMALDAIVQTEVGGIVNWIDLGLIRLIETTMVTVRGEPASFAETHDPAYTRWLTGDLDSVQGVVDVWAARRNDIVPLPSRRRSDDGAVQVVEYHAAEHSTPARTHESAHDRTPAATTTTTTTVERPVPPRVQQWKNALLDLSLRNKLINYSDRTSISLTVPAGQLAIIEDRVHEHRPLVLRPSDDVNDVDRERGAALGAQLSTARLLETFSSQNALFTNVVSTSYASRLRALAYKARTVQEETGANNLYLALGSLVWSIEGKSLRSPLILIPVKLVTQSRSHVYRLELDESGTSTPNYCLLEKLRQMHGLDVPGMANPAEDQSGIDLDAALQAMRVALAEKGLPYRVEPTADLSILQFAKFRLWKDLDDHWETLVENPLVRHLVDSPTEPFVDPIAAKDHTDLDELDALCPIAADASQLTAVADAVAGRTFVLEGPPGTGKSQTITNLLTRAVAEGKRVLFVAEKRAALDVVRQRLDSVGMGTFSLDLHDKGSKPAVVRAQIKQALDYQIAVDEQGLSAQQEDLRASRRSLSRYAQRLHEPNGAALSFYSARTSLLALDEDGPSLPILSAMLDPAGSETLLALRRSLTTLPDAADPARPRPHHPWGFVTRDVPEALGVEAIRFAVQQADVAVDGLPANGPLLPVLRAVRSPGDFSALAGLLEAPAVSLAVLDETRTPGWHSASSALSQELAAFVAAAHPGLDVATPAALDLPLADLHAQAQAAASSSWFGRKKRLLAVLEKLSPALRPDAQVGPKQVLALSTALVQVQTAVRSIAQHASGVRGVQVPDSWNPLTPEGQQLVERQLGWLTWAGAAAAPSVAASPTSFTTELRRLLDSGQPTAIETAQAVQRAAEVLRRLADVSGADGTGFTDWSGDAGLLARWDETRAGRDVSDPPLLSLRRWVAFRAHLQPFAVAGLAEAYSLLLTGVVPADEAVRSFDRGLAKASLAERKASTGLDAFDPLTHDRAVTRFTASTHAVRGHLKSAVPAQVIRARPFDASTGSGQVGALQRELAKQRRGLGVRGLLATYGELITQLMPCVLVSPDSVARFFPATSGLFDIVVFDEASQIRVADAVGAMGRSRSVVVVGDSKQMPPTAFAEPTSGAPDDPIEEEPLVVEDEESILSESVQARVPRQWLSWHYRSKDESLIAFSNAHYYEGRLSSFPAPRSSAPDAGVDGYGISLVRVEGEFQRSGKGKLLRTNAVEAEAVVAEIRRRFEAQPQGFPSLGVITFNQQQRAYIEALLRDSGDDRLVEALDGTEEEGLFVKNLENVQGDERDVILFSTAFSVNDKGVLPLNFGPLNRGGGERRLNVAVTRARRQVIVFSSFDPAQLRAEETSSIGIKHLRAYLDLASRGTGTLPGASRAAGAADRHREEVAEGLRGRDLIVESNVGLSDFTIDLSIALPSDPEQPVMAVLLDGPGWAKRRTVGDRDGLPVQVLSGLLEWPVVERVWLPAWLQDREGVLDQLAKAAFASGSREDPVAKPAVIAEQARAPEFAETLRSIALAPESAHPLPKVSRSGLPQEEAFVPWQTGLRGGLDVLDQLPARAAASQVRLALEEAVAAEGPVHLDRLVKLVAASFGLSRVSGARAESILAQLPADLRPDRSEPFAWPRGRRPADWLGFRRPPAGAGLPLEQVSVWEIGNAMGSLCSAAAGMSREELLREALAVFGGRRLTPALGSRLQESLKLAEVHGRLREQSGLVING